MTIFLCGFMGCGKSTVGKLLAKNLGMSFVDSDELIVEKEQMSIPDIFSTNGEDYFRHIEALTIRSLCGKNSVVACGGGAMLNNATADFAKKDGVVIFLDVPFNVCYDRIKGDSNRPIVASSSQKQLLKRFDERYPVYSANSSFAVCCDTSASECCSLIKNALSDFGRSL